MNIQHISRFIPVLLLTLLATAGKDAQASVDSGASHHIALFVGATKFTQSTEPTAGLEYELKVPGLNGMLGIGLVAEQIFAQDPKTLLLGAAVIHPWSGLKINLGYGQEKDKVHTNTLARMGVGYDVHIGHFSVSPVYNFDRAAKHNIHVFGLTAGIGF